MTAFGPDRLSLQELDHNFCRWNAYRLPPLGPQMHFDTTRVAIDPRYVGELTQVKIGFEFAVDTGKQIQVKSGGYSEFVVIGRDQLLGGLFQVRPQEQ